MSSKKPQENRLSIDELNKAKEKKEAADETMKTRCKICFREIAPQRRCGGHGGGGGGGGGDSGGSDKTSEDKKSLDDGKPINSKSGHSVDSEKGLTNLVNEQEAGEDIELQAESAEERFNPDIIAMLVADKKLLIENDSEAGVITIKLRCDPSSLSDKQKSELKKFINAILDELDAFKKENGITTNCKTIDQDKEGNILSLRIALPTPQLYDNFIKRLADNLLPPQKLEQQEKTGANHQAGKNDFNPTPFSRNARPDANKKVKSLAEREEGIASLTKTNGHDEDESQKSFNPSPFSIKPKE